MAAENEFLLAVEREARLRPDAPAYRNGDGSVMTYSQLWQLSDAIAGCILAREKDCEPVVVLGHKSARMVASFLACLKSGHAFVPVDAEMPASRLEDIALQLGHPLLVATVPLPEALRAHVPADRVLDVRDEVHTFSSAEQTAPDRSLWVVGEETQYIIFTSGSTGCPKGIEVSASNVARFMDWVRSFPVIAEGGRVFLDQPPYSFDLSEYEVVGALSTGGCLYAVSREKTESMRMLFEDLRISGIEVWISTPSFVDLCLADKGFDQNLLPEVRLFLFCGEALHHGSVAALAERFPKARIANTYGPTESTVAVTYGEIGEAELANPAPLPVGSPRPGTEIRIVDAQTGASCAPGQVGEIIIVGDTVAKGYFRNPEKTAAAFFEVQLPDDITVRAYRTGDAGHLDAAGVLHCGGRFDTLVKVNGFRVELEDVEQNIIALPLVKRAVVVPVLRRGRISHLKACVVLEQHTHGDEFEIRQAIKRGLSERVPSYMVPRTIKLLDELPLTCNGKLDRQALAEA